MNRNSRWLSAYKLFLAATVALTCLGCQQNSPVTVTPEAASYLKDAMAKREGYEDGFLRIYSGGTAVTGQECDVMIDTHFDPQNDVRYHSNSVIVVVPKEDVSLVQGLVIDYHEAENGFSGLMLK